MNAHKLILDGYFWELFQGKDLWGGGVRTRQYFKQTVSSLKRKNHGFGVEETAACWETCFQIPVRRLLPGTHGGMHKEMVSCHCLHVSRVPLLISSPACACVTGMLSWPVTYLTNGNDLSIPPGIPVCRERQFTTTILFHIVLFIFSPLCLGIVHDRLQWSLMCPQITADRM